MKTASLLVKAINEFECEINDSVILEYYGIMNITEEVKKKIRPPLTKEDLNKIQTTITGVYEGLIKYKGATDILLDKCYWTNRLDELIHAKYKHWSSNYYREFVKLNIKLGPTPLLGQYDLETKEKLHNYEDFIILDDDHCPTCMCEGYITENNGDLGGPPDCGNCFTILCKLCGYTDKNNINSYCWDCLPHKSLKENIINKISRHKLYDEQRFGISGNISTEDIVELLKNQKSRCWVCDDIVLTVKWKPYCCYQFSIDRIDDARPHDRDNCQISCYYCNCRHHPNFNQYFKVCSQGCHNIKRTIVDRSQKLVEFKSKLN